MFARAWRIAHYVAALLPWAWILAPLIIGNQFYLSEDQETLLVQYPIHHLLGTSLQDEQLPLWTPLLSGGYPAMAEGEMGAMYPVNLLLFRHIDPYTAYQLAMLLAPLLSLATAYAYLIYRRHSIYAALLGGVCFALGGYAVGHLRFLNHLQAMSMLPLALLFAERYLDRRRVMDAALCASSWAVAMLAGSFHISVFIGLALIVLVTIRAAEHPDPTRLVGVALRWPQRRVWQVVQACALLPGALVLAGLLAAPQLLLTYDFLPFVNQAAVDPLETTSAGSLKLAHLVHFFAPHLHGIPAEGTYTLGGRYWETLGYVGVLPLLFCFGVPWVIRRRDRRVVLPLVLIFVAFFFAPGPVVPLYRWARDFMPGFEWLRTPGRFLLLANLGLAMLAASGLDIVLERLLEFPRGRLRQLASVLPIVVILVTGIELGMDGAPLLAWIDKQALFEALPPVKSMPGLGPYRLLSLYQTPEGALGSFKGGQKHNVVEDAFDLRRSSATIPTSSGAANPDASLNVELRALAWPDYSILHNINVVSTSLGMPFTHYRMLEKVLIEALVEEDDGSFLVREEALNLLNFLGVRVVMSTAWLSSDTLVPIDEIDVPGLEETVKQFGIEDPFPRAYLARDLKHCGPDFALDRILKGRFGSGWDPCIVVSGGEVVPEESRGVAGYAKLSGRGLTFLDFTVNLLNSGYLIVRESYAPGWTSVVDGAEVETIPVDFVYRATPIPKGRHSVRQEYKPRGMGLGLGLNLVGLITVAISVLASKGGSRQPKQPLIEDEEDEPGTDGWFR